jgi:hypothetical protein
MRQEVTRAHKGWALDSVTLHNDVLKSLKEDITGPPAVSVHCISSILILTNNFKQTQAYSKKASVY